GVVDAGRVYSHVRVAQTLLRKPFPASMIVYKLRDPERAPALAQAFETLFQHESQSWQDREEANLQLFVTLRMSAAITVSLIILLAVIAVFIASYVPARRAASLAPVATLRGSSA